MKTLDEITETINQVMINQQLLPTDLFFTPESIIVLIIFIPILLPMKSEFKYKPLVIITAIVLFLLTMKAYTVLLIVSIITGFLTIIYKYPRYTKIQKTIEYLF